MAFLLLLWWWAWPYLAIATTAITFPLFVWRGHYLPLVVWTSYGSFIWTGGSNTYIQFRFSVAKGSYSTTVPLILFWVGITGVAVFLVTFLLLRAFLGLFDAFSSFEKRSKNCAKELEWSFLPLPWLFCPMVIFLRKPFLRVPSFSYLPHSPVLLVVCVPPYFWHSVQLFSTFAFLAFVYLFRWLSQYFPAFSLALELVTTFSMFSRTPNSFLMLWGSKYCVIHTDPARTRGTCKGEGSLVQPHQKIGWA